MDRITERDGNGIAIIPIVHEKQGQKRDLGEHAKRLNAAISRLAAYEDTDLTPDAAAQLKQIAEIFNCDPNDPAQLKQLCDKLRDWQQADQDGRLAVANVSGRCGSCVHYRRIEGTARGACVKHPYGKDVICDPQMPYWVVGRSKLKCKLYEEAS